MRTPSPAPITEFNLKPGRLICRKYEIIEQLGVGWEGEVYKIVELSTGIERAAKFFYPERNIKDRTATQYAKKLHCLRNCSIIIQYHTKEEFIFRRQTITVLISEYVHGKLLSSFLQQQRGKRLPEFQAIHLLYALACGLEEIHLQGEYHGDLHDENIIISRYGLGFEIKLLDLFHRPDSKKSNMREDLFDLIGLFHHALGGAKQYHSHSDTIKYICCGLKRTLIQKKFKNMTQLREHLENLSWD